MQVRAELQAELQAAAIHAPAHVEPDGAQRVRAAILTAALARRPKHPLALEGLIELAEVVEIDERLYGGQFRRSGQVPQHAVADASVGGGPQLLLDAQDGLA